METNHHLEAYHLYLRLISNQSVYIEKEKIADLEDLDYSVYVKLHGKSNAINNVFVSGTSFLGLLDYSTMNKMALTSANMSPLYEFCGRKVVSVSCGENHTIILVSKEVIDQKILKLTSSDTEVFGWGDNSCKQLIDNDEKCILRPTLINSISKDNCEDVCAWECGSSAITKSGQVLVWGRTFLHEAYLPKCIGNVANGVKIILHHNYLIAITNESIFLIGKLCDNLNKSDLNKIYSGKIKKVACGQEHVLILDSEWALKGIGSNKYGQLGMKEEKIYNEFKDCDFFKGESVRQAHCCHDFSYIVTENFENVIFGKLGPKNFPKPNYIELVKKSQDPQYLISLTPNEINSTIYGISNTGQIFLWNTANTVNFVSDKNINQRNMKFRKNFSISWTNYFQTYNFVVTSPQYFTAEGTNQETLHYNLTIEITDELGRCEFLPHSKIALYLYVSQKSLDKKEVSTLFNLFEGKESIPQANYQNVQVKWNDTDIMTKEISFNPSKGQLELKIKINFKNGERKLYIIYGEDVIENGEITIKAVNQFSNNFVEEEKEVEPNESKLSKKEKEKLEKEIANQEALEKQKEAQERTAQRANQALKKQLDQAAMIKKAEETERKELLEIKTGGGYDLDKLKEIRAKKDTVDSSNLQTQKIASQEQVKRQNSQEEKKKNSLIESQNTAQKMPQKMVDTKNKIPDQKSLIKTSTPSTGKTQTQSISSKSKPLPSKPAPKAPGKK